MARPIIKFIEFYSGIGGWSHALKKVLGEGGAEAVGAYDHSTICNSVYKENLNFTPSQKSIESLTSKILDNLNADIWMMSPPCQPYTRQRNKLENQLKDLDDPRAKSFLHLCKLLFELDKLPSLIVLENVVGFEESECCLTWLRALVKNGYSYEHFHLTPSDFNYPNSRPRYYLIAKRKTKEDTSAVEVEVEGGANEEDEVASNPISDFQACSGDNRTVADFLELPEFYTTEHNQGDSNQASDQAAADGGEGVEGLPAWLLPWTIDAKVMSKDAAWCFDIVKGSDSDTACFTRSYSRYNKGTGSVLYVPNQTLKRKRLMEGNSAEEEDISERVLPTEREFDTEWKNLISKTGVLRYFTPREVSNLLGFPPEFAFPVDIKPKKAYEMLGNSLHIEVTAQVLKRALSIQ